MPQEAQKAQYGERTAKAAIIGSAAKASTRQQIAAQLARSSTKLRHQRWSIKHQMRQKAYTATSSRYGEPEITDFLTELALSGHVAAGTQNQAISSLTLFHEKVLGHELGFINSLRANESVYLPVVLTRSEVVDLLAGFPWNFKRIMFLVMIRQWSKTP